MNGIFFDKIIVRWHSNFFCVSDIYLLANASDTSANKVIRMQSKMFEVSTDRCLSFYYSMYGENVGSLKIRLVVVDIINLKWPKTIWKREGNQGTDWEFERISYRKPNPLLRTLTDGFYVSLRNI